MNHLKEAKRVADLHQSYVSDGEESTTKAVELVTAHALIAIAEQLALQNQPKNLCQSCLHLEMRCPIFKETKHHDIITTDCSDHKENKC